MLNHIKIFFVTFFSIILLSACSEKESEIDIPLSEVPAHIVTIVQNTLPGITLTEAEKEIKGEITVYELEGKLLNGEEYEIEITDTGTILKIELED